MSVSSQVWRRRIRLQLDVTWQRFSATLLQDFRQPAPRSYRIDITIVTVTYRINILGLQCIWVRRDGIKHPAEGTTALALLQDTGPCRPPTPCRAGVGGRRGYRSLWETGEGGAVWAWWSGASGGLVDCDDFAAALAHPLLQGPAERRGRSQGAGPSLPRTTTTSHSVFDLLWWFGLIWIQISVL